MTMPGYTEPYYGAGGKSPVVPRGPEDLSYWTEPPAGYVSPSGEIMGGYGSSQPPQRIPGATTIEPEYPAGR
jgi:hypothetical protein